MAPGYSVGVTGEPQELDAEQLREIEEIRKRWAEEDPWAENERVAKQRVREDAKRSLGENLMDALGLCAVAIELRDSMRRNLAKKRA